MRYDIIYADPPWKYEYSISNSRKIENHYNTMSLDDIKSLDIPANDNCILFLWVTAPKLNEGMDVIKAWGFNYRSCLVWNKLVMGMGYWFRNQHELLLVAVKGNVSPAPSRLRIRSVFEEKPTKHSRKPLKIYSLIELWFPNKSKIELFSRYKREGWDSWGDQVPTEEQRLLREG